jgi:hypothetical protein
MLALVLLGCGTEKVALDVEGGSDTAGADSGAAAVRPSVVSVRSADCVSDEDAGDIWSVSIGVEDPQNDVDRTASTLTARTDGADVATYGLVCLEDTCSGSWSSAIDGVGCAFSGVFRVVVRDTMGNESAPYDHPI